MRRDNHIGATTWAQRLSYTKARALVCFLCLLVVTLSPFSQAEEQTFRLETDKTVVKANSGEVVDLKVTINNTGTVFDSYEVRPFAVGFDVLTDWDNLDENSMRMWAATIYNPEYGNLSYQNIHLEANESYEFMVKIRVPDNAENGESALIGIVARSNHNYDLFANALITVTVLETPSLSIIAAIFIISVSAIYLYRRN